MSGHPLFRSVVRLVSAGWLLEHGMLSCLPRRIDRTVTEFNASQALSGELQEPAVLKATAAVASSRRI